MPDEGRATESEVVCNASRRAKFLAVRTAMATILGLMFFAAAGGFAWGMWEEVSTSPQQYRVLFVGRNASVFSEWSAKLARLIARLQYEEKQTPPEPPPTPRRRATVAAPPAAVPDPALTTPTQCEPQAADPISVLPDRNIQEDPDLAQPTAPGCGDTGVKAADNPSPSTDIAQKDTEKPGPEAADDPPPCADTVKQNTEQTGSKTVNDPSARTDIVKQNPEQAKPKITDRPPSVPPSPQAPKEPKPAPKTPALDPKVAEALEKAHKTFDIALQYHQKARPDAPASGRSAANKMAIQYLKLAKQQYEAILQQKIPQDLRARIQSRLQDVNRLLYWAMKMSSIR